LTVSSTPYDQEELAGEVAGSAVAAADAGARANTNRPTITRVPVVATDRFHEGNILASPLSLLREKMKRRPLKRKLRTRTSVLDTVLQRRMGREAGF
jgi:hypothetical protein